MMTSCISDDNRTVEIQYFAPQKLPVDSWFINYDRIKLTCKGAWLTSLVSAAGLQRPTVLLSLYTAPRSLVSRIKVAHIRCHTASALISCFCSMEGTLYGFNLYLTRGLVFLHIGFTSCFTEMSCQYRITRSSWSFSALLKVTVTVVVFVLLFEYFPPLQS